MENKPSAFLTLPGAIIIAGAIIAIAIIWVKKPVTTNNVAAVSNATINNSANIDLVPVTNADHILGNPDASIKIVEYSDPSCPYCKVFNATMVEIIDQYGPGGKVAWIYRSFPLDTPDENGNILHPNANRESQALECAALLGGNDKFWAYEKNLYETTPGVSSQSPKGLDPKNLSVLAKNIGLETTSFNNCLDNGQMSKVVSDQVQSGAKAGVTGTPTSFFVLNQSINPNTINYIERALVQYRVPSDLLFVSADKKIIVMSGAMPKALVSGLIDSLI